MTGPQRLFPALGTDYLGHCYATAEERRGVFSSPPFSGRTCLFGPSVSVRAWPSARKELRGKTSHAWRAEKLVLPQHGGLLLPYPPSRRFHGHLPPWHHP